MISIWGLPVMAVSCRVRRPREAGMTAARVARGLRSIQFDTHGDVGLAIVEQRSPVGELVIGDAAVRQVQRLALQRAGIERHRFVVGREGPRETDLLAAQLGIRRMAEAVKIRCHLGVPEFEAERNGWRAEVHHVRIGGRVHFKNPARQGEAEAGGFRG